MRLLSPEERLQLDTERPARPDIVEEIGTETSIITPRSQEQSLEQNPLSKQKGQATKKPRKPWITTLLIIFLAVGGMALVLYPLVPPLLAYYEHCHQIMAYQEQTQVLEEPQYQALLEEARSYNDDLAHKPVKEFQALEGEEEKQEYESILDITGTGIMGYISIPSIEVYLPIYHYDTDEVLEVGAGHLAGSSFPVASTTTHSVISGHTGLPSAVLFSDLIDLQLGDEFIVTVLNESTYYRVDAIDVVHPADVSSLTLEPGENYCTLVTCTPPGQNTHRLLVRGVATDTLTTNEVATVTFPWRTVDWLPLIEASVILLCAGILILLLWRKRRKSSKNKV